MRLRLERGWATVRRGEHAEGSFLIDGSSPGDDLSPEEVARARAEFARRYGVAGALVEDTRAPWRSTADVAADLGITEDSCSGWPWEASPEDKR